MPEDGARNENGAANAPLIRIPPVAMLLGGSRGNHDDRNVREMDVGLDCLGELESIHARHLDVEQNEVGYSLSDQLQRVEPVLRSHDVVAFACHQSARDLAHRQRIVDDHHQRRPRRRGGRGRCSRGLRSLDDHGRLRARVLPLRELHRVDDQNHFAGAEHRGAGNARYARELRADVLHHDFLVADHFVDMDRGDVLSALEQQNRVVARRLRVVPRIAQEPRKIEERILAVVPGDLAGQVKIDQVLVLDLLHLLDHRRRHCPQPAARANEHGLRDRQRQR